MSTEVKYLISDEGRRNLRENGIYCHGKIKKLE